MQCIILTLNSQHKIISLKDHPKWIPSNCRLRFPKTRYISIHCDLHNSLRLTAKKRRKIRSDYIFGNSHNSWYYLYLCTELVQRSDCNGIVKYSSAVLTIPLEIMPQSYLFQEIASYRENQVLTTYFNTEKGQEDQ